MRSVDRLRADARRRTSSSRSCARRATRSSRRRSGRTGQVDRLAARADELPGVAAQRVQRGAERAAASRATCRRSTGRRAIASVLGDSRDGLHAPPVRRRQRLHGAAAEPLPRRSRRRGAAVRARGDGEGDGPSAAGGHGDGVGRANASSRAARSNVDVDVQEPDRPQVPDRLSGAPHVAACHACATATGETVFESGAHHRRGPHPGQRQRRRRDEVRAALRPDHQRRPGADLRVDHGRHRAACRRRAC